MAQDKSIQLLKNNTKSDAFRATILTDVPVQVGEVAEREGAHVVEGLRHSVVRLGHHSTEGRKNSTEKDCG